MSDQNITQKHYITFESIKREDNNGNEYWNARDLAKTIGYSEYRHFIPVINRAKDACINSNHKSVDHFEDVLDMVKIGSGATRELEDVRLSRYACYLIVQNADPSKEVVAHGQTYFAIQTRRQELQDQQNFNQLSEEQRRIMLRNELTEHNKALTAAAKDAGVATHLDYAIFQDHGYKGLYGGLGAKDIHYRKGLSKSQKILDHMGSTELAANLFRATQAEDKLRREKVSGKVNANAVHYQVGQTVRKTIGELGGVMPENLPTPDIGIKQLDRKLKKENTVGLEE